MKVCIDLYIQFLIWVGLVYMWVGLVNMWVGLYVDKFCFGYFGIKKMDNKCPAPSLEGERRKQLKLPMDFSC